MDESEFKDRMDRLSRIVQANRESGNGPEARQCLCRICGHRWNARTESVRPRTCPSCRSSLWDRKELRTVRCYRCGHEWRTSLPHPPRCPSCTSDKWDLKTVAVRCRKCSSVWYDPLSVDKISKCPQCGPVPRDMISPASKKSMTQNMKTNQRRRGSSPPSEMYDVFNGSDSADISEKALIGKGFSAEQAGILHEFICGAGAVEIACRRGKSLEEVLNVVSPYTVAVGRRSLP